MRHEKQELLERLKDVILLIRRKLASPITLETYSQHSEALSGGRKFPAVVLSKDVVQPVFVAPMPDDKYVVNTFLYCGG